MAYEPGLALQSGAEHLSAVRLFLRHAVSAAGTPQPRRECHPRAVFLDRLVHDFRRTAALPLPVHAGDNARYVFSVCWGRFELYQLDA